MHVIQHLFSALCFNHSCGQLFLHKAPITQKIKVFDFYPHTDLLFYDIISTTSWHTETVVLLRGVKTDSHINIDLDVEKLGIHDNKATYDETKAYVSEKYGYKVSSLYIAQVKEKLGIKERENYNIGEGKGVVPHCPPEKEEAIKDALRYFGMIGLN